MQRPPSEMDEAIERICEKFAADLDSLAAGDFLREGVLRETITCLIWGIFEKMPDQRDALADSLENFPDLIRDAAVNEQQKAQREDNGRS